MPKNDLNERNQTSVTNKLCAVQSFGALKQSLAPQNCTSEFQILEFYGDSVLNHRISLMLMQTRRFMGPGGLTQLRSQCVCNANLAKCFDKLKIEEMMGGARLNKDKEKADILEAMIGELSESSSKPAFHKHHEEIERVISALLDFISFTGEQNFAIQQALNSQEKEEPAPKEVKQKDSKHKTPPKNNPNPPKSHKQTPKNNKRHPSPQKSIKKKTKSEKKTVIVPSFVNGGSVEDPILLDDPPTFYNLAEDNSKKVSPPVSPLRIATREAPLSPEQLAEFVKPETIIPPEISSLPKGASWEELCNWSNANTDANV